MNYFQSFSIAWGMVMIGLRLLIHLVPYKWNQLELELVYTEKRPKWLWGLGVISLCIVAITWYKELTTDIPFSIFMTFLVTITLIKTYQLLFNYTRFRKFVYKALIEDRSIIKRINIGTTILGIILILLGIIVY